MIFAPVSAGRPPWAGARRLEATRQTGSGQTTRDWLKWSGETPGLLRCLKRVAELFVLRSGEILQPGPGRV
jgi:hypothetical protein